MIHSSYTGFLLDQNFLYIHHDYWTLSYLDCRLNLLKKIFSLFVFESVANIAADIAVESAAEVAAEVVLAIVVKTVFYLGIVSWWCYWFL